MRLAGLLPEIHRGVDLDAPAGAPVHAMSGGKIIFAGSKSGYGLTVIIDHGEGIQTLYAHLSEMTVEAGAAVDHAEIIGRVGATGNASGAHLHFEIRRNGEPVDPVPLLGGPPES